MNNGAILVLPGTDPGRAVIRVAGGAHAADDPRFSLQRSDDFADAHLGANGWQKGRALLRADTASAAGADLLLTVGDAVCRHLKSEPYIIEIPAIAASAQVIWPEIEALAGERSGVLEGRPGGEAVQMPMAASQGGRDAGRDPGANAPGSNAPRGDDVREEDPREAATRLYLAPQPPPALPTAAAPLQPGRRLPWLSLLLVAATLLAAGYGWMQYGRVWPRGASAVRPGSPPPAADDPNVMSVEALLARNSAAEMTTQAQLRLAAHPQDAHRLLRRAADNGFPAADAAFARYSDPVKPLMPPFAKNADMAVQFYRRSREADVAQDLEALHQWLLQRDHNEDLDAHFVLCRGWPDAQGC